MIKMASVQATGPLAAPVLRCISYNMHGFNQGHVFLTELCTSDIYSIIYIQEHWLSSPMMSKLQNLSKNYTCYGVSAMDAKLSSGFLLGRPFGGTAVLIKDSFLKSISNVATFERLVSVTVCDVLCINVHLPCEDGSLTALNLLHEILANAADIIEQSTAEYILFGGDINVNITKQSAHALAVNEFLTTYKLLPGYCTKNINKSIYAIDAANYLLNLHDNLVDLTGKTGFYTFSNEKLGRYTTIDFLFVTKNVINCVTDYKTLDGESNHSDHLGVSLSLNLPSGSGMFEFIHNGQLLTTNKVDVNHEKNDNEKRLRWDKANINNYYDLSRDLLYPLHDDIENFCNTLNVEWNDSSELDDSLNDTSINDRIDFLYNSVVGSLLTAADQTVPRIAPGCLKSWWSSSLTTLKKEAMVAHQLWVNCGKPNSGEIFLNKTKHKLLYKTAIKNAKKDVTYNISTQLHESLITKDNISFWKTWKTKISKPAVVKPRIENVHSDQEAADKFSIFFADTCSPNNPVFNRIKKDEFLDKLAHYRGDSFTTNRFHINAEVVGLSFAKLSAGKSPGCDGLTTEHLINCHPVVFVILAKLFNLMLKYSHVPSDFERGITIPIPKNESSRGAHPISSFRGITLSPILSKVFEHCILLIFSKYLVTSNTQFGFKSNSGCSHAIYCLSNIVDYFVSHDSTVNLCFLDLSKAFDKINHSVLMLKLMKRNLPKCLIKLLYCWYSLSNNVVRWGDALSKPYCLTSGVRQGSVISPALFSIYVDELLNKFKSYGCTFHGLSVSALMYADDLVLLSSSINELQLMLDMCCNELMTLDLCLNYDKSVAMRIGKGCNRMCCNLKAMGHIIKWVTEAKYLGIYIRCGQKLTCNFDKQKAKFYRAANCIFAKLGNLDNIPVTLHLVHAIALPSLTYGLEALQLTKTQLLSIEHAWSRMFMKLFKTFNSAIIQQCQYFCDLLPIRHIYTLHRMHFLNKVDDPTNSLVHHIYQFQSLKHDVVLNLSETYKCSKLIFTHSYNSVVRSHFKFESFP